MPDTLTPDGAATLISSPIATDLAAGYAVAGSGELEVLWSGGEGGPNLFLAGYGLDGSELFQESILPTGSSSVNVQQLAITGDPGSGAMVAIEYGQAGAPSSVEAMIFDTAGSQLYSRTFEESHDIHGHTSAYYDPAVYAAPSGYRLEVTYGSDQGTDPVGSWFYERFELGYAGSGQINQGETQQQGTQVAVPYAGGQIGGAAFTVEDNQAQVSNYAPVAIPGEPSGAITDLAAAGLASRTTAAVAWVDSGADHVSIFNAATASFGPVIGLDSGGASDLHIVALTDGGFAVSWMNGGAYKGEVFDGAGNGGGVMSLTGDFAGINGQGDLFTVGLTADDHQYVVQTYAINASGGGENIGQNYTSDNNGDTWVGTSGDDVFHLGRGGDTVTGNGGDDTYMFAQVPWAGGHITDFNAGDVLNLQGLMSTTQDTGADGFADGYLKITDDGKGDAQVWAQYATSGSNSGWWLVTTLDHVAAADIQTNGDVVTSVSGNSGGAGGTGGSGQTFTSDNNGDTWVGTSGDDTFHLGRGGDTVTGNGGDDTFAFAQIPWAGGHITDFNAGDALDLTGLVSTTQAANDGSNPFSDGYVKLTDDGAGDAQVWARYSNTDANGWWLVTSLDGVSSSDLVTNGDVVSVSPGGAVSTSASTYTAPANVTAITLTGSQQHIDASATHGVEITSNNTGNTLLGGSGDDTFHLGRGGDTVTGGAGADTFAYAETPWAAGQITDFNANQGDVIDVRGMLQASGYTGSDPFTDGYLRITDSAQGAQIWSDTHQGGADSWWLVGTIDGVSTSSLHYAGGLIT